MDSTLNIIIFNIMILVASKNFCDHRMTPINSRPPAELIEPTAEVGETKEVGSVYGIS